MIMGDSVQAVQPSPSGPDVRFDILTLFPGMFDGFLTESMVKRAVEKGLIQVELHDIRRHAAPPHRACDDAPFGGGGGMVLKPEPVFAAVEEVLDPAPAASGLEKEDTPVILLTPQGRVFSQRVAEELSELGRMIMICGRYEGVDERIRTHLATDEISLGDYVLSGGEVAAMGVIEAVTRLIPGSLGYPLGHAQDSHAPDMGGVLEGPQYTRPAVFRGLGVPEVLVSGHHAKVRQWRREQALLRTAQRRPDLLRQARLSASDRAYLERLNFGAATEGEEAG